MDKLTKKVIRVITIVDYKTLEKYFEDMALRGWLIEKYNTFTMEFRKIEPTKYKFNVSLFYNTLPFDYPDEEGTKSYQELCEESGWILATSTKVFQIFYVPAEENPIPIHTDPMEEYRIIKSTYFKTEFISLLSLLLVSLSGLLNIARFDYTSLYSNMYLWSMLTPLIMLIFASPAIYSIVYLIKAKKSVKSGGDLPETSYRFAKVRGNGMLLLALIYLILTILIVILEPALNHSRYISLLAFLPAIFGGILGLWYVKFVKRKKRSRRKNIVVFMALLVMTIVVSTSLIFTLIGRVVAKTDDSYGLDPRNYKAITLSDLGIYKNIERDHLWERGSIFVPVYFHYYERSGKTSISTEYIRARNEKISSYIYEEILKEYQDKSYKHVFKGDNKIWRADRIHYLDDDYDNVIIRKGNIIVVLEGDFDFSDSKVIEVCRDLLKE
ncbi:DUF2812 domain-containing protein [Wukongibacter baidiensis]|uniref:DUF2812 domain-containing protein n=1 Tax=Wukongibacter baidiensis TaxID=1723361 RepID=UPI003D7F1FC6